MIVVPTQDCKKGQQNKKILAYWGVEKSINRKNKLYHRQQKSKKAEDELLYKKYRNTLNRLLHISEQQHYDNLLKENKNNSEIHGESWNILFPKQNVIVVLQIFH